MSLDWGGQGLKASFSLGAKILGFEGVEAHICDPFD